MAERTLALVEEAGLAYLHVFPFSSRPATPAAQMPPLPRPLVKARAERLRAAGAAALSRHLQRQVGHDVEVLVERGGIARAADFTKVALAGGALGALVRVRLTGHDGRRATGMVS